MKMAHGEITDEQFYKAYQGDSAIAGQVDVYQKKHHAHKSQKGQPSYDPGNMQWWNEAKQDPDILKEVHSFLPNVQFHALKLFVFR